MRVLLTGASSLIGRCLIKELLRLDSDSEIWQTHHQTKLEDADPRWRVIALDLNANIDLHAIPAPLDLVVHVAGITHSRKVEPYWSVNHQGTIRLAEAARARGCRQFVYVSTRCATANAGPYGESKLAAEEALQQMNWETLLIIRPSEIYGAGGKEGVDRLIRQARNWHLSLLLFGSSRIEFAPLHIDDFATNAAAAIAKRGSGCRVMEMCGPEDLSGRALAWRLAKRFRAVPVPVWLPAAKVLIGTGNAIGLDLAFPDQIQRLICRKTSTARTADSRGQIRFFPEVHANGHEAS
jgi:nucleoside-diphosphate-sugar epimerase